MTKKKMKKEIIFNGIVVGEYEPTGDEDKDIKTIQDYLKDKGFWKNHKIEDMMFGQAQSFASTARDLFVNDIKGQYPKTHSVSPFVVNAAFSIELYLKTLHKLSGNDIKGHSLKHLYEALNEEIKSSIHQIAEKTKHVYNIEEGNDFKTCLNHLDNAFVNWRYIYEGKSEKINFSQTIYVMQTLDKTCVYIKSKKT